MNILLAGLLTFMFINLSQRRTTHVCYLCQSIFQPRSGGGYSDTCAWQGGSAVMTPFWGHYFISQHNPIDPLFLQKKIRLSISHLVPEILGPKVGLIFHQNVLFNRFKAFCINFPLIFFIKLTLFFIDFIYVF